MLVEKAHAIKTLGDLLGGSNPTGGIGGVKQFLDSVAGLALDVVGMLSVIMIIYGAFSYATAYGDDAKAETAKKTIIWSLAGLVIVILAHYLVALLNNQLGL